MARQWLLQSVYNLQARLADTHNPEDLQKALKMLSALPIVADILEETGVRKVVKRLRQHQLVGPLARDLTSRWKKLVHLERKREFCPQDTEDCSLTKQSRDTLEEEAELDGDAREKHRGPSSLTENPSLGQNRHLKLEEPEKPPKMSQNSFRRDQRKKHPQAALVSSWTLGSPADGHVPGSRASSHPPPISEDHPTIWKDPRLTTPVQMPERSHHHDFQRTPGTVLATGAWDGTQGQEVGSQQKSKRQKSSRKRKGTLGAESSDECPLWMALKSQQFFSEEDPPSLFSGDITQEKPPSAGLQREEESGHLGRNFFPTSHGVSQDPLPKPRHRACQETRTDHKGPGLGSVHPGEGPADQWPKDKDRAFSAHLHAHEGELAASHRYRTSVVDGFEELLQSFEKFCQEEQPPWKKRKTGNRSAMAQREKELNTHSQSPTNNWDLVQSSSLVSGHQSQDLQPPGADPAKQRKVTTEAQPASPQLLLPSLQVHSSASPAGEWRFCPEPQTYELSSSQDQEEAGFSGVRIHTRMPVFSGSKRHSLLPKMTLGQKDMQDLAKDEDPTLGGRGSQSSMHEPRLEKCTPELCHLEQHNQAAVGETAELWKIRCLKDHKEEKPQEQESWREMYLRLQDAREQRLQALTQRIQSAQAQKPQGRRSKMIVFSCLSKAPRDVPGGQENVGIPGAAPLSRGSSQTPSSSDSNSAGYRPTRACPNSARPPLVPLLNPRKPTDKKMGSLMAKTMKDYKKILSRR